jgi:colanic acid biosynthesis glycosyl transferase WcaI
MEEGFAKYRYVRRTRQELRYGTRLVKLLRRERPDVYLSCNEPLLAKAVVGVWCWASGQPWIYWLQDLYSVGMRRESVRLLGRAGDLLGRCFESLERFLIRKADGVVLISPTFGDWLTEHRIHRRDVALIPNWAPLDELPYHEEDQGWFTRIGIPSGAPVVLYSGTLGRKHDAGLLAAAAAALSESDGHMVVISEGPGADELRKEAAAHPNLHVLPFQPWEEMPAILASATVLVAILAPDASVYSVPSKVLTYLCTGRPIVAAMAPDNLAAQYIKQAGAGEVTAADDPQSFVAAVLGVIADPRRGAEAGRRARAFAESTFDVEPIAAEFECLLRGASEAGGRRG